MTRPAAGALLAAAAVSAGSISAGAISIELKDVSADRIERQRAFVEGRMPLARTPDVGHLRERLAALGMSAGSPALVRIFKDTSELEVWLEKGERFELFATYPICHWSGTLGPKQREGDKQTPEGFYTITNRQMRQLGRWPTAINLGFPNAFDRAHRRDGSYILMHGGCSSVGCFAMTNPVINEVYGLVKAAIKDGQRHVPVHVFPFRLTDEALAQHAASPWHDFWTTLAAGYQSFERTRRPPRVGVCEGEYRVEDALPKQAIAEDVADEKRKRGRSRTDSLLGAVHTGCPTPVVVTAEGKDQANGEAPRRTP
ncbi:MAG: murein L,D-transpeptidase family protein [Hyphomicrobium sp.]|uniref:L,D-transpeptidase family protein n=1 Tax=Hyphomicrobium sp. TaxID=82 RepID=UPI003D14EE2A